MLCATEAREVSRLTKWLHPGPFSSIPSRQFVRRRRAVDEEYVENYSLSTSTVQKEAGSVSATASTGATSRSSGSILRSGEQSEESSFWLEPFFSPASSVSSSDDGDEDASSASSTFQRPPRPEALRSTRRPDSEQDEGEGQEENDEREGLVYNDPENDAGRWNRQAAEELKRVQGEVRSRSHGLYAEAVHAWDHWLHRGKHDQRRLIASHERRFQAGRDARRQDMIDYYDERRRAAATAARKPLENMAIQLTPRNRAIRSNERAERLTRNYDRASTTRDQYIQLVHQLHMTQAKKAQAEAKEQEKCESRARLRIRRREGAGGAGAAGTDDPTPVILQEMRDTQAVLKVVRRAGVVGGVNPPDKPPVTTGASLAAANNLSTETFLTLRPGDVTVRIHARTPQGRGARNKKKGAEGEEEEHAEEGISGKEKGERLAALERAFNVDLQQCRNVTVLKGDALLDRGVILLGQALSLGACEQLVTLHLHHNGVGRLGVESIARALALGGAPRLETLSLQKNNVTGRAVEALAHAAKKGGLMKLKRLDLRYNQCGDGGACSLASALLSAKLPCLERLLLQQNDIKDRGASALHMAMLVDPVRFCPSLQVVSIRQNSISVQCLRSMQPAPPALQY